MREDGVVQTWECHTESVASRSTVSPWPIDLHPIPERIASQGYFIRIIDGAAGPKEFRTSLPLAFGQRNLHEY